MSLANRNPVGFSKEYTNGHILTVVISCIFGITQQIYYIFTTCKNQINCSVTIYFISYCTLSREKRFDIDFYLIKTYDYKYESQQEVFTFFQRLGRMRFSICRVDLKEVFMTTRLEKIKGCMFGGAVGDALGYPVEFRRVQDIFTIYGEAGICNYELFHDIAYISDDTQMTLFTANGLLAGYTRVCLRGIMGQWQEYVKMAYKNWLQTQDRNYESENQIIHCWLMNYEEFYNNRAPGNTCLSALYEEGGSISNKINYSKGCGGIMRVAPVGLYLTKHIKSIKEIDMVGAEVAAITHSHPLGYIPAATLTHIIARCVTSEDALSVIVKEAVDVTKEMFANEEYVDDFFQLIEKAIQLSDKDMDDLDAIRELGQGWVAEETLAIAIYCSLKYKNDFIKGVIASINHDGDSDSTGALTGNILGVYLGINQIPEKFIKPLELRDVIDELATDMHEDCRMSEYGSYYDEKWWKKYVTGEYYGRK